MSSYGAQHTIAIYPAFLKCRTLSNLSDMDTQHFNISAADKQESMEEVNTEISIYCGMLYSLVQVFKGDEEFGEELSALFSSL